MAKHKHHIKEDLIALNFGETIELTEKEREDMHKAMRMADKKASKIKKSM